MMIRFKCLCEYVCTIMLFFGISIKISELNCRLQVLGTLLTEVPYKISFFGFKAKAKKPEFDR